MTDSMVTECDRLTRRTPILPLLFEMGKTISECKDLQETISILLRVMKDHIGVTSGMFTLHNRKTGKIFIHESLGLTAEEEARGVYDLGEGITGKVVETGKAIIVPRIREEPNFLGRTRSLSDESLDFSFICIPVSRGKNVLGVASRYLFQSPPAFISSEL